MTHPLASSALESQLAHTLHGRVCVLGIGNRQRGDDGVGSLVAEKLVSRPDIDAVDAGCVPENHLETVAGMKPDTILMIDAADFGGAPGNIRLLRSGDVAFSGLSTHAGSITTLAEYLHARTGANVAVLAIQPLHVGPCEGLSDEVMQAAIYLQERLPAILCLMH
jgi:hydrogenase 3 maturation protease